MAVKILLPALIAVAILHRQRTLSQRLRIQVKTRLSEPFSIKLPTFRANHW